MNAMIERRTSGPGLSPREAAFVTGLSEKTINQAIDRAEVGTLPSRREGDRERMLPFSELLYLRLRERVGSLLSPEGKRQLRQQLTEAAGKTRFPVVITLGPIVIKLGPEFRDLKERLKEVERVWTFVTVNTQVRAGEPVVRGTRIPVYMLADLSGQGAPAEELLEDYPSLTPESLEAALTFARLYPRRGRPPRAPWRDGVVIRRGS